MQWRRVVAVVGLNAAHVPFIVSNDKSVVKFDTGGYF